MATVGLLFPHYTVGLFFPHYVEVEELRWAVQNIARRFSNGVVYLRYRVGV